MLLDPSSIESVKNPYQLLQFALYCISEFVSYLAKFTPFELLNCLVLLALCSEFKLVNKPKNIHA